MSLAKKSVLDLNEDITRMSDASDSETDDDTSVILSEEEEVQNEDDEEEDDENEEEEDDENEKIYDDEGNNKIETLLEDNNIEETDENNPLLLDEDEEIEEESYRKLEDYFMINNLENEHPEIQSINSDEIYALTKVVYDSYGNISDPLHKTLPFITKYEKARIIGARAEQLDRGSLPFIETKEINGRTIANKEFDNKKIPFIIARPLPNKQVEYWNIADLEVLV